VERLRLLYRDAYLVVVDKPSGLLSHRGWGRDRETVLSRTRDMLGQWVHLPHRLDRATSGAMVVALDEQTLRRMMQRFEAGEVNKQYLALVRGQPPERGSIDHPIRPPGRQARLAAVTDFERLGCSPRERCSLVRAWPRTGRPHQIRRHLKHISHPLIGDTRYGDGKVNRHYRAGYGLHRLALHAERLAFEHPVSGERIDVRCPLPPDLSEVLEALGLEV
jgi:tRNA pseudouridine65 synthase